MDGVGWFWEGLGRRRTVRHYASLTCNADMAMNSATHTTNRDAWLVVTSLSSASSTLSSVLVSVSNIGTKHAPITTMAEATVLGEGQP